MRALILILLLCSCSPCWTARDVDERSHCAIGDWEMV